MRSSAVIVVSSSLLLSGLVAASGMPHMIEDSPANNLFERQQYGPTTSTSTEYVYVTLTRTIHTTGPGGPYTSTIYPTVSTPCTTTTTPVTSTTVAPVYHTTSTTTPCTTTTTTTPCTSTTTTPHVVYPKVKSNTTMPHSTWTTCTGSKSYGTIMPTYKAGNATAYSTKMPPQPSNYPLSSENGAVGAFAGVGKIVLTGVVGVVAVLGAWM